MAPINRTWVLRELVYVKIGNPDFCLTLYLTGLHFRGELQHSGHVGEQKNKCQSIKTRGIGGLWLQDKLCYKKISKDDFEFKRLGALYLKMRN